MKISFLSLILMLAIGLSIQSCGPEEGCTNPLADNYNPDAEEDDGTCVISGCTDEEAENYDPNANNDNNSCIYARDKFLGEYMGTLLCGAPLPPMSDFTMEITEGLDGNNAVQIEFKDTANPLPILSGTAEGNKITVEEDEYDVALNPDLPDVTTKVLMSAEATISDDEKMISGTLTAKITPLTITCTFDAVR